VPPFVLAGVDGGRTRWESRADDDPQRMLRDEVPIWCADRGYDTSRMAAHGWSMGGYGSLLLAARNPSWLRAAAVLSPAVGGGELEQRQDDLDGSRVAIWCGTADSFKSAIEDFAAALPEPPAILDLAPGGHTRGYWNRVTPDAFAFVGARLAD
jgi:S-formylglutathione hydrolase FrmB